MIRTLFAVAVSLVWAANGYADSPFVKNANSGNPDLKSIDAITCGPDGLLVLGDSKGTQIVVVETGDVKAKPWTRTEIANITGEIAGRLGVSAKDIDILKVAVSPASHTAYFAVRNRATSKDLVVSVDGTGKISELALDNLKHVRVPLPTAGESPITKISDLTWAKDRILVACQANDTFASKIISIPLPLDTTTKGAVFSTETYHVGHGKWETKAPIRTVIPYEENGVNHLVGAFTCTPIVKYPVTALQPGAKIKGTSVIELGTGNTPLDMFVYEKGGKKYILISTVRNNKKAIGASPYWTFKVDHAILGETAAVNEKAPWRVKSAQVDSLTDRAAVAPAFYGVVTLDRLDAERALAVRTDDKGNYGLVVLPLP